MLPALLVVGLSVGLLTTVNRSLFPELAPVDQLFKTELNLVQLGRPLTRRCRYPSLLLDS